MNMEYYNFLFKVVLAGNAGVGKTCQVCQFTQGMFPPGEEATIGVDGCKAFGQLEFWHRALSAYGILSIGILAYGILSIPLLAYSILAIHLYWHSHITITAWTFDCVKCCSFA